MVENGRKKPVRTHESLAVPRSGNSGEEFYTETLKKEEPVIAQGRKKRDKLIIL